MAIDKEHKEFHALDMRAGWETPAGYPAGIEQKILAGYLDEYDDWFQLDQFTACALYQMDPGSADFILKHLPLSFWGHEKREMWSDLANLARTAFFQAPPSARP
jgi:hypothetical protein